MRMHTQNPGRDARRKGATEAALPPRYPGPKSFPCPRCGAGVVSVVARGAEQVYCPACPWELPDVPVKGGGL